MSASMMKFLEECEGVGDLERGGERVRRVSYHITRYQAFAPNGMPVPGLHRVEGSIAVDPATAPADELVGEPLTLRLEDGRAIVITLASPDGRVLAEGHGPSRCCCC
jgi:hypothetical protein